MKGKVTVQGLNQFTRSLRKLDADAPKELKVELQGIADLLITRTKRDIPKRTGNAANSLKARSTQRAVRVGVGGRKAPYYPWLDFGGRTGINESVVRPFYTEGRYLYPNLRKLRPVIEYRLQESLRRVATNAGMEVSNG